MLGALMSTDNSTRNAAEEALNQAKQNPDGLFTALITMLRRNADEQVCLAPQPSDTLLPAAPQQTHLCRSQVRSLSAVLLRKEIMRLLSNDGKGMVLSAALKELLKRELLMCIEAEPSRSIRKKVSDVVGQLGISIMSNEPAGWPELLPFMLQATKSTNVQLHEAALTIFNSLSEFIASHMQAHHSMLLEVFRSSLQPQLPLSVRPACGRHCRWLHRVVGCCTGWLAAAPDG